MQENKGVTPENMALALQQDSQAINQLGRPFAVIVSVLTFLVTYLVYRNPFYEATSYAVFLFLVLKFIADLGKGFPIREVIGILAVLQWLVAPAISYKFIKDDFIYFMPITKEVYFRYAFPGTMAYLIGLNIFGYQLRKQVVNRFTMAEALKKKSLLPYGLIIVALVVNLAMSAGIVPASLNFFGFLLSGFLYIGLFHNLFSEHKNRKTLMYIIMGSLFFFSIANGMFHEFILWCIFLIIIFSMVWQAGLIKKLLLLLAFVFLGFVIQSLKTPYRLLTWNSSVQLTSSQKNLLFFEIAKKRLSNPASIFDLENIAFSLARVNEGWIISRIMYHTPSQEPYANGETISEAAYAVFLPRILAPDKAKGGGRKNFLKYTGLELNEATSMNISQLGEAYANYGERGGIICIFIYGLLINIVLSLIFRLAHFDPLLILWIPLLFLQVIKAEIDFMTAINHLFKSGIVVIFALMVIKVIYNRKQIGAIPALPASA